MEANKKIDNIIPFFIPEKLEFIIMCFCLFADGLMEEYMPNLSKPMAKIQKKEDFRYICTHILT